MADIGARSPGRTRRTQGDEPERRTAGDDGTQRPNGHHRAVARAAAYGSELVGTFLLVFFIGAAATVALNLERGSSTAQDFILIGLVAMLVLAFLIYTLADVSGAHFNPAVTLGLLSIGQVKAKDVGPYLLCQLVGAVLAALTVKVLMPDFVNAINGPGAVFVSERYLGSANVLRGFGLELMGTAALMWAIVGIAVNPRGRDDFAGLIIGGTLGFVIMALAPLTGAGMNPARAFGPNLVGGDFGGFGKFLFVYVLGPVVGALIAAQVYRAVVLKPQEAVPGKPVDHLD